MDDSEYLVLVIAENPMDVNRISACLGRAQIGTFRLERIDKLADGIVRIANGAVDAVLIDVDSCDNDSLDAFHDLCNSAAVVVLTGQFQVPLAIKWSCQGGQDFLIKTRLTTDLLERTLHHAIVRHRTIHQLRESLAQQLVGMGLLASSLQHQLGSQESPVASIANRLVKDGVAASALVNSLIIGLRPTDAAPRNRIGRSKRISRFALSERASNAAPRASQIELETRMSDHAMRDTTVRDATLRDTPAR